MTRWPRTAESPAWAIRVGALLRERRVSQALSLQELAARVGKSVSTLSRIETGEQTRDVQTLIALCSRLEVNPARILLDAQTQDAVSPAHRQAIDRLRPVIDAFDR